MLGGQTRETWPIDWVLRRGVLAIEKREEILRGLSPKEPLA